jgi:hypothetical protein
MALLGNEATISVSTDGTSYTAVGGINTIDIDEGYNTADIGEMGDVSDRLLPSTAMFSGSASGVRDSSDAGQTIIKTAIQNRTLLYIKVLEDGTSGVSCQCAIGSMKRGAKQGPDAQTFSFDFTAAGGVAPTVIS